MADAPQTEGGPVAESPVHQAEVVAVAPTAASDSATSRARGSETRSQARDGTLKSAVSRRATAKPAHTAIVVATNTIAGTVGGSSGDARGAITIITFGYDFGGPPAGCRFVADVRNIDAGDFAQDETGLMPAVMARVMATSAAQTWLTVIRTQWVPALKPGDVVAIGCARGHHRSVALGVILSQLLQSHGYSVNLVHRDILKTW